MHTKSLGNLGEALVLTQCLAFDCEVFTEFGDNSKIDLIINFKKKLYRVQVKLIGRDKANSNITSVMNYKSGPNYQFKYEDDTVDWFAVVDKETHSIAWINSFELLSKTRGLKLRHDYSSGNNGKPIRYFSDYCNFPFKY